MARYVVVYEGAAVAAPGINGPGDGFFVTAWVTAPDEEAAEARGRLAVYRAWSERMGGGGSAPKLPQLDVSEISRCGWLRARLSSDGVSGFIFFGPEQPEP